MFSPRPWGWSVPVLRALIRWPVFPTPVGMVRGTGQDDRGHARFPHARGDGPLFDDLWDQAKRFSPRPWGWSGRLPGVSSTASVFPTPVGMVRSVHRGVMKLMRFPHARGDGPPHIPRHCRRNGFSPRPWGWSGREGRRADDQNVFPTPVGMVRTHCDSG